MRHWVIVLRGICFSVLGRDFSAGVPIGYDPATWPAPELIHPEWGETYMTYDINDSTAKTCF